VTTGNVVTMTQGSDIERLIRCQHGAVSRAQLRESGVSANTIDTWVRRGKLRRVLHGVYATGAPSLATRAHAVHLGQPEGVVSHLAAAHLWKMAVDEPATVHFTVPLSCARTSPVPWLRLFRRDTPPHPAQHRRRAAGHRCASHRLRLPCAARRRRVRCPARPRHGDADLRPSAADALP
jgi:Transcriptional regulator, AbiEi antitoxin